MSLLKELLRVDAPSARIETGGSILMTNFLVIKLLIRRFHGRIMQPLKVGLTVLALLGEQHVLLKSRFVSFPWCTSPISTSV